MEENELKIQRLKKALNYAIKKLKIYSTEDESCRMGGRGVFLEPKEVVDEWIKEIRKIEKGEEI